MQTHTHNLPPTIIENKSNSKIDVSRVKSQRNDCAAEEWEREQERVLTEQ